MGERMTCPVCDAHTSGVLSAVRDGGPCPYCNAPAELILEVTSLKARATDEKIVQRVQELGVQLGKAQGENERLQRLVMNIRDALAQYDAEVS